MCRVNMQGYLMEIDYGMHVRQRLEVRFDGIDCSYLDYRIEVLFGDPEVAVTCSMRCVSARTWCWWTRTAHYVCHSSLYGFNLHQDGVQRLRPGCFPGRREATDSAVRRKNGVPDGTL